MALSGRTGYEEKPSTHRVEDPGGLEAGRKLPNIVV